MKSIIIIFLLFSFITFSQNKSDVRNTSWGMTKNEVISSEYPLKPKIKDDEISYEIVDIGNGYEATILYFFKNERLSNITFIVHGSEYLINTCDKITPFINKVSSAEYIFNDLKNKNYLCSLGWRLSNGDGKSLYDYKDKIKELRNCNTETNTLKFIQEKAIENNSSRISVSFANKRTFLTFTFNEHQNSPHTDEIRKLGINSRCDGFFFNIRFWMKYEPSNEVMNETSKSRF